ncbi:DUF7681 family protein [Shewanella glacialipiscicola]|uniref:Acb2/Tad1 domain-containing protein n=1 Tax=Shewanella glacialipiscicola TaxID=614069 RepID=UPI003D7A606E
MDNQHKKIKGYRDLSQQEIDLMNRIKEHGEKTKELIKELRTMRGNQYQDYCQNHPVDLSQVQLHESVRCLDIAQEKIQTGQMWFVRAVALPESF